VISYGVLPLAGLCHRTRGASGGPGHTAHAAIVPSLIVYATTETLRRPQPIRPVCPCPRYPILVAGGFMPFFEEGLRSPGRDKASR